MKALYIKTKNKGKNKELKKSIKKTIKQKVIDKSNEKISKFFEFLELPKEIVENTTRITVVDNSKILLEGTNKILDYYEHYIRLKSNNIEIMLDGKNLDIEEISDTHLIIKGEIISINYKGEK